MRRPRIGPWLREVTRTRAGRVWLAVFAFFLVNTLWSFVGNWSVDFGGERFRQPHGSSAIRRSGVFSDGGFLVLAVRQSTAIYSGLRSPYPSQPAYRTTLPPSISARVYVGAGMGLSAPTFPMTGRRPYWFPSPVRWEWDASPQDEWYTRAVAVRWSMLTAILAILWALTALRRQYRTARDRRRVDASVCTACGYDLRATPDRCPECGTVPLRE